MERKCRVCDVVLSDENCYPSRLKKHDYICKKCHDERMDVWCKANPDKSKDRYTRRNRRYGILPFDENKECTSYLGVYIAEGVLHSVFKDVEVMPHGNHGYDFICNRGKKIDVKSGCLIRGGKCWMFNIDYNVIADYFLCVAFDDRKNLNPMYIWLIPGDCVSNRRGITISVSTIHKWDSYRLDISKVVDCCNVMRRS